MTNMIKKKQVVHVDDDENILSITRMALELVGDFEVVQFGSACEALEQISDLMPDLFLLDVMMPEMSGPEFLANIRKRPEFKDTPAVFMTAKAESQVQNSPDFGDALACITKPFDPLTLHEKLNALLCQSP
ncbi:response regulator [Ruegeria sp. SCPT10]|uniref:response regulator n=1 Tax=Ruegeria sp. SCP10 TaxID=3141377 RepID=UPI003339450E